MTKNATAERTITSLEEGMAFIGYTRDENGLYFYDAGYPELWEADEETVRHEIALIERHNHIPDADADTNVIFHYHQNRLALEALRFVLAEIMARPGHIPLADLPEPEWKKTIRETHITTLPAALAELEAVERDGAFYDSYPEEGAAYDEEWALSELEGLKALTPETDELIDFYPYHEARRYCEALEVLLAEMRKRR